MPDRSSIKPRRSARASDDDVGAGARSDPEPAAEKNPAAVALGRLGGKKGGLARAQRLSARRRSEIARKAARARWDNAKDD